MVSAKTFRLFFLISGFINSPPTTIMRNVMASASEAECGALFNNTKEAVSLRTTLHEMGYPQPPTPVEVKNSTAVVFANKQIKQHKSKAMDMRYCCIQNRVSQKKSSLLET